MTSQYSLIADPRTEYGHAVKKGRVSKRIPATVYGNISSPINLYVEEQVFLSLYKSAGKSHVIRLLINKKTYPVLIQTIQKHPVTHRILHVEFLAVNLKEKMTTTVPLVIEGECPAVESGKGTLLLLVQEVEIESLPENIPERICVSPSSLTDVDQEIKVKDLIVPNDVTILSDQSLAVARVVPLTKEEPGEQPQTREETITESNTSSET